MTVQCDIIIAWFLLSIGFSLLISLKLTSLLISVILSSSLIIAGIIFFISNYASDILSKLVLTFFYPIAVFIIIFIIYIFIKKEISYFFNKNISKLLTNLIPRSCWKKNARTIEPYKSKWAEIKRIMMLKTKKCEICGLIKSNKLRFECHEEWNFNKRSNIQKLEKIMLICRKCHQVKHIGNTKRSSYDDFLSAKRHLSDVNAWSNEDVSRHITFSLEEVSKLNKIGIWKQDMKWVDSFIRKNKIRNL